MWLDTVENSIIFFQKNVDQSQNLDQAPDKDVDLVENVEEDEEPDDEEMQEDGTEIEYHCPVCSKIFDKVDISYLSSTILDVTHLSIEFTLIECNHAVSPISIYWMQPCKCT